MKPLTVRFRESKSDHITQRVVALCWAKALRFRPNRGAEQMTFRFRYRFRLFGPLLHEDAHEFLLKESADGERVSLVAVKPDALIKDSDRLALEGVGYNSREHALASALQWRQYMIEAFAAEAMPIEFCDDLTSTYSSTQRAEYSVDNTRPYEQVQEGGPNETLAMLGVRRGDRLVADRDQLQIFESEPAPRLMYVEAFAPTIGLGPQGIRNRIEAARATMFQEWSAKVDLAYKLLHASLRDLNPETRFIQLVTAFEALLPSDPKRPTDELAAIDLLQAYVDQGSGMSDVTKTRMSDMLRDQRRLSIRRSARDLLENVDVTYDGQSAWKLFDRCYELRSTLVHGGSLPVDAQEYGRLYAQLLDLARHALKALTTLSPETR